MAGRRTSLASLAGGKVDPVPGLSDPLLLTLPLSVLVPTRFNPRRNFGTEEDLKAFGLILKRRQLQPAVVVSRNAYLKLWPEEAESAGQAKYVIANGERRFRGSKAADLATLNVVHNEDVAKTRADFLDAVLSENNDREDLDPIERALGIETMVVQLGGADKVAAHYEKTKGWVSQQRKLLKLTPELQDLVSAGELPIRVGRDIAGLPAEEQAAAWAKELKDRKETRDGRRAASAQAKPSTQGPTPEGRFTAVNQSTSERDTEPRQSTPKATARPASPPQTPAALTISEAPQVGGEPAFPEPRRSEADESPSPEQQTPDTGAEEAEAGSPGNWVLPPDLGWEELLRGVVAQMGEFDRHMLTRGLNKVMEEELGAASDSKPSESTSA